MSTGIEALRQQARDMGTASDGTFMTMRTGDVRAAIAAHDDALAALAGARAAQQELERQAVAAREQLSEAQARLAEIEAQKPVVRFPRQPNGDGGWTVDMHYVAAIRKDCPVEWQPCEEEVEAVLLAVERAAHAAPAAQVVADESRFSPPFDNCKFELCDLPGQCRNESKCHHPQRGLSSAQQPHRLKETSVVQSNNSAGPLSTQADTRAASVERAAELAGRVAGEETAKTIRNGGVVLNDRCQCIHCMRLD